MHLGVESGVELIYQKRQNIIMKTIKFIFFAFKVNLNKLFFDIQQENKMSINYYDEPFFQNNYEKQCLYQKRINPYFNEERFLLRTILFYEYKLEKAKVYDPGAQKISNYQSYVDFLKSRLRIQKQINDSSFSDKSFVTINSLIINSINNSFNNYQENISYQFNKFEKEQINIKELKTELINEVLDIIKQKETFIEKDEDINDEYIQNKVLNTNEDKIQFIGSPTILGYFFLELAKKGYFAMAKAASGEMTIMSSGSPAAYAKCQPVLEAIAGKIYKLGDEVGPGSVVKMVNQLLAGVHIAAAGEAMALAIRAGADPEQVYEVITNSAGNSWMFQNRVPHILAADYTPLSAVNIFIKDLGIVLDYAKKNVFPLPLSATAHQMYLQASAAGHGMEDDSAVIKMFPGIKLPEKKV